MSPLKWNFIVLAKIISSESTFNFVENFTNLMWSLLCFKQPFFQGLAYMNNTPRLTAHSLQRLLPTPCAMYVVHSAFFDSSSLSLRLLSFPLFIPENCSGSKNCFVVLVGFSVFLINEVFVVRSVLGSQPHCC